jgi:osmotically-inducible protein OsmY
LPAALEAIKSKRSSKSQEVQSMFRERAVQAGDRSSSFERFAGDLADSVADRLRSSGYPSLWSVKCEVRDGVVVLSGIVPTFHLKQVALKLATHTQGVGEVRNDVQVTGSDYRTARPAAAG